MKMYASCPICAHKLCKGDSGSTVEIYCPRCSHIIRAEFTDKKVIITLLESQRKTATLQTLTMSTPKRLAFLG